MTKFLEELLKWLKETVPTALAVGTWVHSYMRDKLRKEEKAHDKTKLEKELVNNELQNDREFAGRSDADIIKSAVRGDKPS